MQIFPSKSRLVLQENRADIFVLRCNSEMPPEGRFSQPVLGRYIHIYEKLNNHNNDTNSQLGIVDQTCPLLDLATESSSYAQVSYWMATKDRIWATHFQQDAAVM